MEISAGGIPANNPAIEIVSCVVSITTLLIHEAIDVLSDFSFFQVLCKLP